MLSNLSTGRIRRTLILGLGMLALVIAAGNVSLTTAGQAPPGEYDVKAAFVYNFLKFVEWPARSAADAKKITVCTLGDLPTAAAFDDLDNQELMGSKLTVRHLARLTNVRECQVLFIASSEERRLSTIMAAVQGSGILTIGDAEGFAQRGVIINFIIQNKKVRFEINAETARQAGLKISSKLMKLASTVYGAGPAGE